MIKVVFGNNVNRSEKIVDPTMSIRQFVEENNVNVTGTLHLNGRPVIGEEIYESFADFGVKDRAFLMSIVKADNA